MSLRPCRFLSHGFSLVFVFACSSSTIYYDQKPVARFTYRAGPRVIEGKLEPVYTFEWRKPLTLSLDFAQSLENAERIKTVEVRLFAAGPSGEFTKEIALLKREVTVEYFDGKQSIKRTAPAGDIRSLIDAKMKEYKYRDTVVVLLKLDNVYDLTNHPDTLLQKIIIQWEDKPEEVFTSTLTKKEYSRSCISGRPYG